MKETAANPSLHRLQRFVSAAFEAEHSVRNLRHIDSLLSELDLLVLKRASHFHRWQQADVNGHREWRQPFRRMLEEIWPAIGEA